VTEATALPFERLDFLYMPSRDVAADLDYFMKVLGARVVFAVEGMGARVAMLDLTEESPRVMLADHLGGERPVLVYRVPDLEAALEQLERRGWEREQVFEIPYGPICSFRTPGGHRIAVYERSRPEVHEHFAGRRDF
jgi:predicted enzyme related to lactoylglutathione lyase